MSNHDFGWELMYKIYGNEIRSNEDALVVFVHWGLTKYGFRCIGIGSEAAYEEGEIGSQLLPEGWNSISAPEGVCLRYIIDGKLFVLRYFPADNGFILNFLRVQDYSVSSMLMLSDEVASGAGSSLTSLIPRYKQLMAGVYSNLVAALHLGNQRDRETQTVDEPPPPPYIEESTVMQDVGWDPNAGRNLPTNPEAVPNLLRDLRNIGRADLDPLAGIGHGAGRGMGGGMIFNPLGNRGLGTRDPGAGIPGGLPRYGGRSFNASANILHINVPRGAVPPGARFDPFGPPNPNRGGPNRFASPDNDHLPPPGYDDMFM